MVVLVLIALVLALAIVQFIKYKKSMLFTKNIPSVEPCLPVVGNGMLFLGKSEEEQFTNLANALSHPAKLFILWFGTVPMVSTNDPHVIQKICTQPEFLERSYFYEFFKLDYGIFSAKYHIWKNQRKALNPTFNKKILDSYIPQFDRCAQNLVRKLSVHADKEPVQLTSFMLRCTLEMVCATTLGVDINQNPGVDKLVSLIMTLVHLCSKRIVRIHHHSETIYRLSSKEYKEDTKLRKEAYRIGNELLQAAIDRKTAEEAQRSTAEDSAKDDDGFRKSQNFVDQLLDEREGSKLEVIEILHNVYTIIVAGSDTSGTELGIISLMLATHPEMQEKVYEEIMTVYPADVDLDLNPETLRQLVYTEMFLKECLRHFPVAPHIFRTPMKDVELEGVRIPKGTMLCISIYNTHRRQDLWGPNAEKFDPEMFSPEQSEGRHPFAFMPFSAGARNCLGYRYAMISLKVVLVHLVRNFRLKTHLKYEDVCFKFDCLLKLSNEPAINLERRFNVKNKAFGWRKLLVHLSSKVSLPYSGNFLLEKEVVPLHLPLTLLPLPLLLSAATAAAANERAMWLLLVSVVFFLGVVITIIGSKYFLLYGKNEVQRFGLMVGLFRNCKRLFRVRFGPLTILCTNHPEVIQQILPDLDCVEKPLFYRFTGLENGLLSAKHHIWKSQRKVLNSTFNLKILNNFIPIFESCCYKMVQEINKLEDGSTINILNYASKCTLEMVFGTTIGMDELEKSNQEVFLGYIERLFNLVSERMLTLHLHFNWIYRFTNNYREDRKLRSICMESANQLITDKKLHIASKPKNHKNITDNPCLEDKLKIPKIFIEQLLENSIDGRVFTSEEIYHNAYTVILAGNDTSALSLAYTCLFLAMYPHIQNKVYAEIQHNLPDKGWPITLESLKQLEFMDMCIKETLRLCPVVPNIARQTIKNISIDGQAVPKDSIIILSLYTLHRRVDFWGPNASQFNPENFHPDRAKQRHPYAYLPFSGGPRNCIGWRYAMLSIKVMLVHLLRNFKLHTSIKQSDLRFKFDLTLKLAFDHQIQLEKRRWELPTSGYGPPNHHRRGTLELTPNLQEIEEEISSLSAAQGDYQDLGGWDVTGGIDVSNRVSHLQDKLDCGNYRVLS
ncbi:uncharacterized protein LOC129728966 [Wyeomyia smithii]|uniref:uncharacterized protein LOC129728966 n=1 Tax=Wyeomyia smithii TaxID=174621 RepID=UPI0024681DDF|nr:uncharacterized protein LOC129728966 [Wyeomyia smithii]